MDFIPGPFHTQVAIVYELRQAIAHIAEAQKLAQGQLSIHLLAEVFCPSFPSLQHKYHNCSVLHLLFSDTFTLHIHGNRRQVE